MTKLNLLLIASLVTLASCAPVKNTLVGAWTYDQMPNGIDFTMSFAGDGTWTQIIKDGKTTLDASGTYKFENDSLAMIQTKGIYQMGAFQSGRKEWSSKVRWITEDMFEMSDLQPPTSYKRKK